MSDGFCGPSLPSLLSVLVSRTAFGGAIAWGPRSSPRRRSMVAVAPCDIDRATAATSSETKRNPIRGSNRVTLHLDLDDLTNPDEADRLHHERHHQHRLPQFVGEQQMDVVGADEGQ